MNRMVCEGILISEDLSAKKKCVCLHVCGYVHVTACMWNNLDERTLSTVWILGMGSNLGRQAWQQAPPPLNPFVVAQPIRRLANALHSSKEPKFDFDVFLCCAFVVIFIFLRYLMLTVDLSSALSIILRAKIKLFI